MNSCHDLIVIHRNAGQSDDIVVRWCRHCGAIVVDIEYDNRIVPGGWMEMTQPRVSLENNCYTRRERSET